MQKTRNQHTAEFMYQALALLLALIVVHATYTALIRPKAEVDHIAFVQAQAEDPNAPMQRSVFIVLKDYEQESCFILMLWAMAIMGYKAKRLLAERNLLEQILVNTSEGERILPEDVPRFSRPIQALTDIEQQSLLPRALLAALQRFGATENIQDVSHAVESVCEAESNRLESELSMVRYIAWAIPSIGFIGTVRGIGQALSQAHLAVQGDIASVTASLGVAFNSTFIALLISIILMFLMHQLQLLQDRLVLDVHGYCDQRLIRNLRSA
ncbi:MAG: MotA/TolQ/ExbB proton channel family protein [Pseudomonadales bacterium]